MHGTVVQKQLVRVGIEWPTRWIPRGTSLPNCLTRSQCVRRCASGRCFAKNGTSNPAAIVLIREAVRQRYSLAIVDVVLSAVAMRRFWGTDEVDQIFDNEYAMTKALLQRASMIEVLTRDIHRDIAQKLGLQPKGQQAAE